VPAPDAKGSVVLIHGLNRSRIEMVRRRRFRARGLERCSWTSATTGGAGRAHALGATEKLDVWPRSRARQKSPGPVVVWGVSLGGATATLAAADDAKIGGSSATAAIAAWSTRSAITFVVPELRWWDSSRRAGRSRIALYWLGRAAARSALGDAAAARK
jgi:alpha-beta hydrolase superfamily lysophospholipase